MVNNSIRFVAFSLLLGLAACGEGWEFQRTTAFPYGNERTAGTGVAYVLAKMMPEKELKIVPVVHDHEPEAVAAPEPEPQPTPMPEEEVKGMEPVFKEKVTK